MTESSQADPAPSLPPFADVVPKALAAIAPAVGEVRLGRRRASAIVWSAVDGTVVTTARLFYRRSDTRVEVAFGGEAHEATLLGFDPGTDLAALKVVGAPLVEPVWHDDIAVGHFVVPVARSEHGVRAALGMVSGLGPGWVTPSGGAVDRWIDVDGTLPPGFSGGPLVDLAGRVLGLNTRGVIRGGTTLPRATIARVVETLVSSGTIDQGFLGVGVQSVRLPDAVVEKVGRPRGLLVTWVGPGSAAREAGIIQGDAIVTIDGRPIADLAGLRAALTGRVGQDVPVEIVRAGSVEAITARPTARQRRRRRC